MPEDAQVPNSVALLETLHGLDATVMLSLLNFSDWVTPIVTTGFPLPEAAFKRLFEHHCLDPDERMQLLSRHLSPASCLLVLTAGLDSDALYTFFAHNVVPSEQATQLQISTPFASKPLTSMLRARYGHDPAVLRALLPLFPLNDACQVALANPSAVSDDQIFSYVTTIGKRCPHSQSKSNRCSACGVSTYEEQSPLPYLHDLVEHRPDLVERLLATTSSHEARLAIASSRRVADPQYLRKVLPHTHYQTALDLDFIPSSIVETLALNPALPERLRPAFNQRLSQDSPATARRPCRRCPAGPPHKELECMPVITTPDYAALTDPTEIEYVVWRSLRPQQSATAPWDLLELAYNPSIDPSLAYTIAKELATAPARRRLGTARANAAVYHLENLHYRYWSGASYPPLEETPLYAPPLSAPKFTPPIDWYRDLPRAFTPKRPSFYYDTAHWFATSPGIKNAKIMERFLGTNPATWVRFLTLLDKAPSHATLLEVVDTARLLGYGCPPLRLESPTEFSSVLAT